MNIPLAKVDILPKDIQRVTRTIRSGWIMQGPQVGAFEKAVAIYCGVSHTVATSSGTTALHLALHLAGVTSGDEVIVPSFSWIASANSVRYCSATPVFCDADGSTYNMTPETVAPLITSRTKAILLVHQFGMPCHLGAFSVLSKKHGLALIEDAACAIGSQYENKPVGNCHYSTITCLSFHPRKVVTTGEGGMLLTNDIQLAKTARILRNHGAASDGTFTHIGYNYRMTDMQAALGVDQIARLKLTISKRRAIAQQYCSLLGKHPLITLPEEPVNCQTNYQSFMVRLRKRAFPQRDTIAQDLAADGIACRKSIAPAHMEPCYTAIQEQVSLPQTEQLAKDGLILPLFSSMTKIQVKRVCLRLAASLQTRCG